MYVASVISIQDVTDLAHKLQEAHSQKSEKEVRFCCPLNKNLPSLQGEGKGRGAGAGAACGEDVHALLLKGEVA